MTRFLRIYFLRTALILGALLVSFSALTQEGGKKNLLFIVTDQQEAVSAVEQEASEVNLEIYPNPAREIISVAITLPLPAEVCLSLVDMKGRIVKESQRGTYLNRGYSVLRYSLNDVRRGAYLLVTEVNGQKYARIIVKQK